MFNEITKYLESVLEGLDEANRTNGWNYNVYSLLHDQVSLALGAVESATAEMHARELHHFETEKMLAECEQNAVELAPYRAPSVDRGALSTAIHDYIEALRAERRLYPDLYAAELVDTLIESGLVQEARND